MSAITLFQSQVPAHLVALRSVGDDAMFSVPRSGPRFPKIGMRGKVWRIKRDDEEKPVLENGAPAPVIYVAFVAAREGFARTLYDREYDPNNESKVLCFSLDGVKPHEKSAAPQCTSCAACPKNKVGSKVTEQGKKTRACGMRKDVLVVPCDGQGNVLDESPYLLTLPAVSAYNLDRYAGDVKKASGGAANIMSVVTSLQFNIDAAFPEVQFNAVQFLSPAGAAALVKIVGSDDVQQFLGGEVGTPAEEAAEPQVTSAPAPAPAPAPVPQEQPKKRGRKPKEDAPNVFSAAPAPQPATVSTPAPVPTPAPQAAPASNTRALIMSSWGKPQ